MAAVRFVRYPGRPLTIADAPVELDDDDRSETVVRPRFEEPARGALAAGGTGASDPLASHRHALRDWAERELRAIARGLDSERDELDEWERRLDVWEDEVRPLVPSVLACARAAAARRRPEGSG